MQREEKRRNSVLKAISKANEKWMKDKPARKNDFNHPWENFSKKIQEKI